MSDVAIPSRPLLQPVLTLQKEPMPKLANAGGKKEKDIKRARLATQRRVLTARMKDLREAAIDESLNVFGGYTLLIADMFDDSFATTWTPRNLFYLRGEVMTRAAAGKGYIVEIDPDDLPFIERRVGSDSVGCRCDVSRVKDIRAWSADDIYRRRSLNALWLSATEFEKGRGFIVWLSPFRSPQARVDVLERLDNLHDEELFLPTAPRLLLGNGAGGTEIMLPDFSERQDSLAIIKRDYRASGHGRGLVEVPSSVALHQLISSGAVFRIEPAQPLQLTSPGSGAEPSALPQSIATAPTVGSVDGGCTAGRYRPAEAWRETPLISNAHADTRHGNQVASMIIHGHEWNNNLPLPELYCRIGVAQAVPRQGAAVAHNSARLVSYIENALARHPETRVWNFSWNERVSADPILVSALGHDLSILARRYKVLFVTSAGNVSGTQGNRIAPPADCEAALVVGGRQFNDRGELGDVCPQSLPGFGPEFQLVPHVTTYSPLRVLGGVVTRGTSFQTGLISALASHTFENLRDPTPDLVKALIINCADRGYYDQGLGWGTPCIETLPWNCAPGSVTLAFRTQLKPGILYYWNDIPIPPEMVSRGKIQGSISLTTIHQPFCNEEGGPNYFATRVGSALQYRTAKGQYMSLIGSKEVEDTPEKTARSEEFKWQPTRRLGRTIMRGIGFSGTSFRLYARLFARNVEQFGYRVNADLPPVETVFVMTFSDGSKSPRIYNSMAVSLGNYVESAVIHQDIPIEP
jgi:hypothetical protein